MSKDRNQYIAGIVLAAGGSSRMRDGQQKLLLPLGDRPVLIHVLETILVSQLRPIVVVLGNRAIEIRQTIDNFLSEEQRSHLYFIENRDYTNGMSSSLHMAIQNLMERDQSTIAGAMILLGDQPFITTEMINALISVGQEDGAKIVAPRYNGKRGNPVIFSAELFVQLLEVVGDEGGRSVIERHRADVRMIEMKDMRQNHDVDTWEAYQRALTMWQEGLKEG